MTKTLDVVDVADAKKKIGDVKVFGDGDAWKLICKASSQKEGWMKSTKALHIFGAGCLVQVSTQQKFTDCHGDTKHAVAEAVTFVPGVGIVEREDEEGKMVRSLTQGS